MQDLGVQVIQMQVDVVLLGTVIAGMTDRYAIEEHQKLFNQLEKP